LKAVHDIIIIGSGIGGLACATALSKLGHKVLVLEQHHIAGGLTQTFSRRGFSWDVGIHYLGEMGPGSQGRRILDWLSGGVIKIAPIGPVYDIAHFPDGFEIAYESPADSLKRNLKKSFPESSGEIDAFFSILKKAARESTALFVLHSLPRPLGRIYYLWAKRKIRKWWGRTTDQVLRETIHDEKLRSVLTAQWGDHGGRPKDGSFAMHATIMNHFMDGAYYPVGGARVFAESLVPIITSAGGEVRVKSPVKEILVEHGRAAGVRLGDGTKLHAARVVSAIGARDTLQRLLPQYVGNLDWGREILSIKPSCSHICLYLAFEGDIRSAGATAANHWFYETWDTDAAIWSDPGANEAPGLFVSFSSLKDLKHAEGENQKHTGEVATWVAWDKFSKWKESSHGRRPDDYKELKERIGARMLEQFKRHFPAIAPLITYYEVSTPLTMEHYVWREHGSSYGLETTPKRFLSRSLGIRTPIKRLYLAGQDVVTPGITGAMMGGILAAAAIDYRVFRHNW
jgi:all-trans-retinol 13,14-reductase